MDALCARSACVRPAETARRLALCLRKGCPAGRCCTVYSETPRLTEINGLRALASGSRTRLLSGSLRSAPRAPTPNIILPEQVDLRSNLSGVDNPGILDEREEDSQLVVRAVDLGAVVDVEDVDGAGVLFDPVGAAAGSMAARQRARTAVYRPGAG
jgi:hypothetical protein